MYDVIDMLNIYKAVKNQKPVKCLPNNLSNDSLKSITDITNMFNTRWSNIDPSTYFKCGFTLWKGFSYSKFLDKRVLQKYIKYDKALKRELIGDKKPIVRSFNFIKLCMFKNLKEYGSSAKDNICQPIYDYIHNNIDPVLVGYMLFGGIIKPNEMEIRYIDSIVSNKKEISQNIKTYKRLINRLEKEL